MHCLSEILYEYLAFTFRNGWFVKTLWRKGDDFFFSWGGGPAEKATLIRYKPEESFVSVGKKMELRISSK